MSAERRDSGGELVDGGGAESASLERSLRSHSQPGS